MKTRLLFFAMLITTSVTFCQMHEHGTIELIPNIGYSGSDLYGDDVEFFDPRGGIQFGLVGDYYFNDRWSIRSGLSYFSMGAKEDEFELKLDYLNIPLNANWHFGKTRRWNLNFGLTPGFLLTADFDGEDVKEGFESFQLAFSYGIGYKIGISEKFSLLIDLQAVVGLTNIIDDLDDFSVTNSGSSINVGGVFVLD